MEQALLNLKTSIDDNSAEITYDSLPNLLGDYELLILLFQNLIGNSIKYRREEKPKIIIAVKKELNQYLFSCKRQWNRNVLPHISKKIFTIFQRLHTKEEYEGTGIGLSIAQKIVHQHMADKSGLNQNQEKVRHSILPFPQIKYSGNTPL